MLVSLNVFRQDPWNRDSYYHKDWQNKLCHQIRDYISQNGNEVNIIFGVVIDKKMDGVVQAMVIATDFEDKDSKNAQNDYQQPMPNQNYQQTVTENAPAGNFPVFSFNPNKNG